MIPITRKEHYLNRITGNKDYPIPEKPITTEEFFFADILGEAVQAPEPLTRYQIYLAKIAGKNIEIPYPETRLEYFLAKAAGMNIETPTPITREEIFWRNYSAIVDFEVEGVPPLTYKAIEGTLETYRIYGNTVGGESVGDLVESGEHAGEYKIPVTNAGKNMLPKPNNSQTINGVTFTVNNDGSVTCNGSVVGTSTAVFAWGVNGDVSNCILTGCPAGGSDMTYRLDIRQTTSPASVIVAEYGEGVTIPSEAGAVQCRIRIRDGYVCDNLTFYPMIRKADIEDDTYEPYRAPVTTPIYLPEPIKMVGDEAEYIDYGEQKMHRVRKNLLQNTGTSQTINGVTFTVNSDGSVTCNGTASAITYFNLNENFNSTLYAGMKASFYQSGQQPTVNTFMIQISKANRVSIQDFTMNDQVIIDNGDSLLLAIRINSGYTCDNLTFYPMIRKADIEDDTYEPYIENVDVDVTLPALPTLEGTNILTVGTAVQPPKVYIKGEKGRE